MKRSIAHKPIIIVGCTRSGTKLISRIIGGHPDNFLITEHREKFHIPEDKSGVCEEYIWWNNFAYKYWDKKGEPLVREPIFNEQDIVRMREILLRLAGDKRLIIKNPQNILRIQILKKMFPDALYIFCVRNPWHGLQSRIIGGQPKYLIGSQKNYDLPDDLLLKSIYSWKESIDIYNEENDVNWHVVRYEDTVFKTHETIKRVFDFLGMRDDSEYFKKAVNLSRDLKHRYYPVKKAFKKSKFKKEIMDIVNSGCKTFFYNTSVDSVPGDAWQYYFLEKKILPIKAINKKITKLVKKIAKKIIRIFISVFGDKDKLYLNPLAFGVLPEGGSTLITQDDDRLKEIVLNRKKDDKVTFNIIQMQYFRIRNFKKIIIMDSKGKPLILLKNVAFSPAKRYDYTLVGDVEYIKKGSK